MASWDDHEDRGAGLPPRESMNATHDPFMDDRLAVALTLHTMERRERLTRDAVDKLAAGEELAEDELWALQAALEARMAEEPGRP
jgi:hypothetical protein